MGTMKLEVEGRKDVYLLKTESIEIFPIELLNGNGETEMARVGDNWNLFVTAIGILIFFKCSGSYLI